MKVELDKIKLTEFQNNASSSGQWAYIKDLTGITSEGLASIQNSIPKTKQFAIGVASSTPKAKHDNNFGPYNYIGCMGSDSLSFFPSVEELLASMKEIEKIEEKISSTWTPKEKAVFLWGYLALNFKHNIKNSSDAVFWHNKNGICRNFSKALNLLLLRQGIESYSFASNDHVFNMVKIDNKFYPVDSDFSADHKLKNGFAPKNYFLHPAVQDIFDYSDATPEELNKNFFEEQEVNTILNKVLPSYLEKRENLQTQTK